MNPPKILTRILSRLKGESLNASLASSAIAEGASSEFPGAPALGASVIGEPEKPQETGRKSANNTREWQEAEAVARECEEFIRLTEGLSMSLSQAARELGRSPSRFSGQHSVLARFKRGGVAALLPDRRAAPAKEGLSEEIEALAWFVPAARHFYLLTNRTMNSGSIPEAIRRTISLPHVPTGWKQEDQDSLLKAIGQTLLPSCPAELRERILAREKVGKRIVPGRIARQILVSKATVRVFRNRTEADLDFLSAPGGLRLWRGKATGSAADMRLARAGEIVEADDGTINFPVCVPWTMGGDRCSDKYGVRVGRFQWLVSVCAGTSFIPGFSYTARPRGSYRGEDILALMRIVCLEHGIPRRWRLERGVWKSHLVTGAVKNMGAELETVYSPHQKPFIEGLFNTMWTKLSVNFPRAQVGRFMGENEESNETLIACQQGRRDPREAFPMLSDAIGAFTECIVEKNQTSVNSDGHGRWVPAERWGDEAPGTFSSRKLSDESRWLFSPWVREWTVKGMLVGGRVPIFEDFSVPFDFSAPWLLNWDGAKVRCYFDPSEPQCEATVCLCEAVNGHRAGEVLGRCQQVNEIASYARLVMGWGEDPVLAGRKARQEAAASMRREARAIVPKGTGKGESEERDGAGGVAKMETGGKSEARNPKPETRNLRTEVDLPACREMGQDPRLVEFLEDS